MHPLLRRYRVEVYGLLVQIAPFRACITRSLYSRVVWLRESFPQTRLSESTSPTSIQKLVVNPLLLVETISGRQRCVENQNTVCKKGVSLVESIFNSESLSILTTTVMLLCVQTGKISSSIPCIIIIRGASRAKSRKVNKRKKASLRIFLCR